MVFDGCQHQRSQSCLVLTVDAGALCEQLAASCQVSPPGGGKEGGVLHALQRHMVRVKGVLLYADIRADSWPVGVVNRIWGLVRLSHLTEALDW